MTRWCRRRGNWSLRGQEINVHLQPSARVKAPGCDFGTRVHPDTRSFDPCDARDRAALRARPPLGLRRGLAPLFEHRIALDQGTGRGLGRRPSTAAPSPADADGPVRPGSLLVPAAVGLGRRRDRSALVSAAEAFACRPGDGLARGGAAHYELRLSGACGLGALLQLRTAVLGYRTSRSNNARPPDCPGRDRPGGRAQTAAADGPPWVSPSPSPSSTPRSLSSSA